jgi:sugar phosphate isomerase/epimerase
MAQDRKIQVHVPYPYILEKFESLISSGINPEIYMDGFFIEEARPFDLERLRESFGGAGLSITLHGPYMDMNPGSMEEPVRLSTVRMYEKVFKATEHLRPRAVVLHAGYHEKKYKGNFELWLSQSLKTWPALVEKAERLGTVIAVENIFEREPSTLRLLMDSIKSPNFGICLDAGHLRVFSKVDMEEWFASLGPKIAEVHLHDNHGKHDDHLPLGEGSIDVPRFLSLLKQYANDPIYTIEPHGEEAMKRAIEAVKKYL